jgi:hypothetical protein
MDGGWLAAGPDDAATHLPTVYLIFHNLLTGAATHNMWVMKSVDNGASFGPPVPITVPGTQAWLDLQCFDSGGPGGFVADEKTGRLFAFWGTRSSAAGGCGAQPLEVNVVASTRIWAATSPDNSPGSWTTSLVVDRSATGRIVGMQYPSGAVDRAGNVWVVYPESPRPYPDYDGAAVWVRWAPPDLKRWSRPLLVARGGGAGNVLAHIVAGAPGKIAVAYFHGSGSGEGAEWRFDGTGDRFSASWYLMLARSDNAMKSSIMSTELVSPIRAYGGTASGLMGVCRDPAPLGGVYYGLYCPRGADIWGITLDRKCMVHIAWPAAFNSDTKGTYVSSQVRGPGLC